MDTLNEVLLQIKNSKDSLKKLSPLQITRIDANTYELVPYTDTLTVKGMKAEFDRLRSAFPQVDEGFFRVLAERIVERKFTDQQLQAAVNYLIDHFKYPHPTIADILGFSSNIRLYTYEELCHQVTSGLAKWTDFRDIDLGHGVGIRWVRRVDAERYNLPFSQGI